MTDNKVINETELTDTARDLVMRLKTNNLKIATAESCTGGLVSALITGISGSSDVFDGGIVSYSNEIKHKYLDVSRDVLAAQGAVCADVAIQMAIGVANAISADVGIGITGIAGPTGGSAEKPVGTVFISAARKLSGGKQKTIVSECHFDGDRQSVRYQSAKKALDMAMLIIEDDMKCMK